MENQKFSQLRPSARREKLCAVLREKTNNTLRAEELAHLVPHLVRLIPIRKQCKIGILFCRNLKRVQIRAFGNSSLQGGCSICIQIPADRLAEKGSGYGAP